jgi:hypothetical protein
VDQGLVAFGLETIEEAADVTGGDAKQARGLGLGAEASAYGTENGEAVTFGLTHGDAVLGKHDDRHGSSLA